MDLEELNDKIRRYATELRLSVIRAKYKDLAQKGHDEQMTFLEFLHYILHEEVKTRKKKRTTLYIKKAGLSKEVKLDLFELPEGYGLDKRKLKIIRHYGWMFKGDEFFNLIIVGANGSGKTLLVKGIICDLAREGMKSAYLRFDEIMGVLQNMGTDPEAKKKYDYIINEAVLVVIEDVHPCKPDLAVSMAFALMVDILHEKASIIITSRRPVNEWKEVFFSDSITKSILERLIFHSETISLKGPSFRIAKHKGFFDEYDENGDEIVPVPNE